MTDEAKMKTITDTRGRVQGDWHSNEPECGSVVLTSGPSGTGWQRWHVDGKWHRLGGGTPRSWSWLLSRRNVVLVHEAPARVEQDYCLVHKVVHYEGHESPSVCKTEKRMVVLG